MFFLLIDQMILCLDQTCFFVHMDQMNVAHCVNQMCFFLFSKAKLARKMLTVGKRSRVAPGWLPSDYQLKNSSGKYKSRSLVAKQI